MSSYDSVSPRTGLSINASVSSIAPLMTPSPTRTKRPSLSDEGYGAVQHLSKVNGKLISDMINASVGIRFAMADLAKHMEKFSKCVGQFGSKMSHCLEPESIAEDGLPLPDASRARHLDVMASLHQLGRYYKLMADLNSSLAESMLYKFETPVIEYQTGLPNVEQSMNEHFGNAIADLDVRSAALSKKQQSRPDSFTASERHELETIDEEIEGHRYDRLKAKLRLERNRFKVVARQLQYVHTDYTAIFDQLANEELEGVPELFNTTMIQHIISVKPRPSEYRTRRPGPALPQLKTAPVIGMDFMNTPRTADSTICPSPRVEVNVDQKPNLDLPRRARKGSEPVIKMNHDSDAHKPAYESRSWTGKRPSEVAEINLNRLSISPISEHGDVAIILYDFDTSDSEFLSVRKDEEIRVVTVEADRIYATRVREGIMECGWIPIEHTSLSLGF